ncbi:MAG: hypothetical protein HUK22_08495, partial [Thermoguttaceae bacterium]|nr:hypothetical protein [Thermoguttaceae bacterium]
MKKFCAIAAAICCLIATVCARAAESDAPSWAVKFAANRLWTSPGAEIESAFAPEFELVEDEWILRGQSTIAPPVISPTPSTDVGTHTVATASTHIPLPPAVSQDTPFSPTQAPTTEDSTTIQKVFRNKQSCSL